MHSLIEQHRDAITALCLKHEVRRLWLFGSAARTDFNQATSDLDFLVDFGDASRDGLYDRYFKLWDDLKQLLHREIDLVESETISNPYVQRSVDASRIQLYAA